MARIYPFRAWRYNPSSVRLTDVVTQPSEKISPAMQQAYYQRSPCNLVRVILGLPELFDAERGESVYTRASRDFTAWREQGILVQEKSPCIFAYSQRFTAPGTQIVKERRSFIALGRLYEYSEQVVFRLEQSPPNLQSDELSLLNATHAHFGQILMLYSDPAASVEKILYDGNGPAEAEVTDEYGVLHRLWRVSDPAAIRLLTTAMADKKLIVADGRHRYETALQYAKERASNVSAARSAAQPEHSATQLPQPPCPEAAAMMTFVNMDSGGLEILPAHGVVRNLEGFDPAGFAAAAEQFFQVEKLPPLDAADLMQLLASESGPALVAVSRSGAFFLRSGMDPMAGMSPVPPAAAQPEPRRHPDANLLSSIVFERLLGLGAWRSGEQNNVRILHNAAEALEQVRRGEADLAILAKSVSIEQIREMAFSGNGRLEPPAEFFPRLLSGLAIYALD